MSFIESLTPRSGSVPITSKDTIKNILRSRMKKITITAWANAYRVHFPTIAKDTGRMRIGFNKAGQLTIQSQRGTETFVISKNEVISRWVKQVPYAEHHTPVGPTGKHTYRQPSEPGTRPFKWDEFAPVLRKETVKALRQEIQQIGMQLRRGS